MTDAFRCNGCGEYWDDAFRFLEVYWDKNVFRIADFTMDDVPIAAFGVFEDGTADFCHECGREVVEELVELGEERGGV